MRAPRWMRPMIEARGLSKWILIAGIVIVVFFVFVAIFAPLIAPYGFDQVTPTASASRSSRPPIRRICSGPPCSRPTCSRG